MQHCMGTITNSTTHRLQHCKGTNMERAMYSVEMISPKQRHLAWNPMGALCEPKACGSGIYLFALTPTTPMVRTMDPKLRSNATLHGHGHRYYHVSLVALQGHQHGKGHVQC